MKIYETSSEQHSAIIHFCNLQTIYSQHVTRGFTETVLTVQKIDISTKDEGNTIINIIYWIM
jgi:hypothetical protein